MVLLPIGRTLTSGFGAMSEETLESNHLGLEYVEESYAYGPLVVEAVIEAAPTHSVVEAAGPGPLVLQPLGPITAEDLVLAYTTKTAKPTVAALREHYHEIARLYAIGHTRNQIARRLGKTPEHVGMVINSPAFKFVQEQYRGIRDQGVRDMQAAISEVAEDGLELLRKRIAEGSIKDRELAAITVSLLDRDGYSPVKKSMNVNYSPGAMKDARAAIKAQEGDRVNRATDAEFEVVEEEEGVQKSLSSDLPREGD